MRKVCFLLAALLVSPALFSHVVLLDPTALLDVIEASTSGHQH